MTTSFFRELGASEEPAEVGSTMFPMGFKWIDDIRDKFESMCSEVDEEASKYIEDLQTVGTNVRQFCSTVDPLKYVEDQLQTVGTNIEQLYSGVVPSSMDTMLSTINDIFPGQEPDSTTCEEEPQVNVRQVDHDDSKPGPVMPAETSVLIVSDGKSDNSSLGVGDNDNITEEKENDCAMPDEAARVDSSLTDEKTSSCTDESYADEGLDTGISSPRPTFDSSSSELEETAEADDKITQNPQNAELSESYVLGYMSDGLPQEPLDESLKKQSLRNAIRKRLHKMRTRRPDTKSRLDKEQAISLPESLLSSIPDSWESDWEII